MDTLKILQKNKDKPFVKRILKPDNKYVKVKGMKATHLMAAEIDENGNAWAFPTLVKDKNGKLIKFNDAFEAMEYNKKKGNAIQFKSIKEAVQFTQNYKTKEFQEYYK